MRHARNPGNGIHKGLIEGMVGFASARVVRRTGRTVPMYYLHTGTDYGFFVTRELGSFEGKACRVPNGWIDAI